MAGLGTALACARDGHHVTILERDATPMPETADAAFEWQRRGAPQVRHSHAFLARMRNLLRDRAPDVLESLFAAGATEIPFTEDLPPTLTDRSARPGDEDLVALACRRTTFEWVLRRAVLAQAGRRAPRRRRRGRGGLRRRRPAPRHGCGRHRGRSRHRRARPALDVRPVAGRDRRATGARGAARERHRLLLALLPAGRRGRCPPRGEHGRRRPRLPEVRGVPRRQRHVLDHLRGRHRTTRSCGARSPTSTASRPRHVRSSQPRRGGGRVSPSRSPTCT